MAAIDQNLAPPCGSCSALCCKAGAHGWAGGACVSGNIVPYANGKCPALGDDDRCTLFGTEHMPSNCRDYNCRTDERFLRAMPEVAALTGATP